MSASWPTSWQGSTDIECGEDGTFLAVVTTEGHPCGIHAKNFETIIARWAELWPEFRRIITELMLSYGRESPQWSCVNCIYIDSPAEPIVEDAEWSIGVTFSGDNTLWSLPYGGWAACSNEAQAIH
jgi:hypothetical protein